MLLKSLVLSRIFLLDLQFVFDKLVDITEPICQDIDNNLASMLLFDTSSIEAYVAEKQHLYKIFLFVCYIFFTLLSIYKYM